MIDARWEIIGPFIAYMAITLGAAIFARKAVSQALKSGGGFMEEYYVAGRSLRAPVLAFTFLATIASAGTFIGYPGFAYQNGMTVIMTGINQIAMAFIAFSVIGKRMAQIGRRTGALTFTDVLRRRFDHPLIVGGATAAILIFFLGFMVGQFAGAARILETVAGVPYPVGVVFFVIIVALTVILGGFRAVAWTDGVQGFFMLLGLSIVLPAFIILGGGLDAITSALVREDPALVFGPGPDNWLPPSMLMSYWFLWVWIGVSNPATAMRFLAAKDAKSIHHGLIIGTIIATIFYVPMFFMGAGARAIFPDLQPDLAMPTVYLAALPDWLAGIALAAPFSAVMSTVDSLLLVMSAAIVRDIFHQYARKDASPQTLSRLSYAVSGIFGVAALILALQPPKLIADYIIYFGGGIMSAFFAPVIAALYWPRATTRGAIASIFGGFGGFMLIETIAKDPFNVMSYVWGVLISSGLLVAISRMDAPPDAGVVKLFYGSPDERGS